MESSWLICFKTENIKKTSDFLIFSKYFQGVQKETNQQTFVLKTSYVFVFRGRLQDIFKTSWTRRICLPQPYFYRRRLQDVFKTSSRRLAKMSSRRVEDVFKTCWRRLQDMQRYFQDVFKMYHQLRLFLLTRVREVFRNILFQRRLSTGGFA